MFLAGSGPKCCMLLPQRAFWTCFWEGVELPEFWCPKVLLASSGPKGTLRGRPGGHWRWPWDAWGGLGTFKGGLEALGGGLETYFKLILTYFTLISAYFNLSLIYFTLISAYVNLILAYFSLISTYFTLISAYFSSAQKFSLF